MPHVTQRLLTSHSCLLTILFPLQGCQVGQNEKTAFAYKPKYVTTGIDHGSDLYKFMYTGGKDTQIGM